MVAIRQRVRFDWVLVLAGVTALTTVVLPHAVGGWSHGYGLLGATLVFGCAVIYILDRAIGEPKRLDRPSGAAIVASVTGTLFVVMRTATLPGGPHARILIALTAALIQLASIAILLRKAPACVERYGEREGT